MPTVNVDEQKIGKYIGLFFILIIGVIFLLGSFYQISAGERGILLTFGSPDMIPKAEGLHFKIPLVQKIVKMDIKTQKYESDLTAASKDLQDINTKIAINYHLVSERVPEIYRDIGISYSDKVIQPLEQEANKAVTAQFTAEELITKRDSVRQKMKETLIEKLSPRGIIIEDVSIVNFKFSDSFTQAIENKVTMEQNALAARNKLEQIKYEKEQMITQAQGQAEALRLQKQEVTPDLISLRQIEVMKMSMDNQKQAIEKWNGLLPLVTGGSLPLIDSSFMSLSLNRSK